MWYCVASWSQSLLRVFPTSGYSCVRKYRQTGTDTGASRYSSVRCETSIPGRNRGQKCSSFTAPWPQSETGRSSGLQRLCRLVHPLQIHCRPAEQAGLQARDLIITPVPWRRGAEAALLRKPHQIARLPLWPCRRTSGFALCYVTYLFCQGRLWWSSLNQVLSISY